MKRVTECPIVSIKPANVIRTMPVISRRPNGSFVNMAAVDDPTMISVINNNPAIPGFRFGVPHITAYTPGSTTISSTGNNHGSELISEPISKVENSLEKGRQAMMTAVIVPQIK